MSLKESQTVRSAQTARSAHNLVRLRQLGMLYQLVHNYFVKQKLWWRTWQLS